MAIKKTTATQLRKLEAKYASIPSENIELIKNPDALAIYVYLCNQASGWKVRAKQIEARFNIGKDRRQKAMRELRELNLVWDEFEKDEKGRIVGKELNVSQYPISFMSEVRETYKNKNNNQEPDNTAVSVIDSEKKEKSENKKTESVNPSAEQTICTENPPHGQSDPLTITNSLTINQKKKTMASPIFNFYLKGKKQESIEPKQHRAETCSIQKAS